MIEFVLGIIIGIFIAFAANVLEHNEQLRRDINKQIKELEGKSK
jgi:uncharacterized membrane-anchored protein YhcB (DUF1043 family)